MKFFTLLKEKIRGYFAEHGYTCDACGKEVFDYPTHRLCTACEENLPKNQARTCQKCGRQTLAEGICLTCKVYPPSFTQGFSPLVYKEQSAGLVNRLKNGNPYLALYLGEKIAEYFLSRHEAKAEGLPYLIIPIPLTEKRMRERGYNQATELAESLYKALTKQGISAELDLDILQKTRETGQQKHMTYLERMENASGAYHIHKRTACRERTILLVDDILTTGATGGECAKLLKNAGAKEVYFLTATALPERDPPKEDHLQLPKSF